ncbi:MAG: hypothetical protein RLY78_3540 [Pseudomonadota bacterium]
MDRPAPDAPALRSPRDHRPADDTAAADAPGLDARAGAGWPALHLRTLDRGDGLLGLRPCGPVPPGQRRPVIGARAVPLSVAWLAPQAADGGPATAATDWLQAQGLHPLPASALQWRGPPPAEWAARTLWTLPREEDHGALWDTALPAWTAAGHPLCVHPGHAHAPQPVDDWRLWLTAPDDARLQAAAQAAATVHGGGPLAAAAGRQRALESWLLGLGVVVAGETLDLVPMLAELIRRERRWTRPDELDALADTATVRLRAPGGRRILAPAGPLKAICGALLDLLQESDARARERDLALPRHDVLRLQQLQRQMAQALRRGEPPDAGHPSAWRAWQGRGEADLPALAAAIASQQSLLARADTPVPDTSAPGRPVPDGADTPPQPAGLGVTLRPYQRQGLAWLQGLRALGLAGILADDMGLGKTAQTLAHLRIEQLAGRLDLPALVVVPASLLAHWAAEAARIAPTLRVLVLDGGGGAAGRATQLRAIGQHELVITSYPRLWRDVLALQGQRWHLLVLDEAQMVKNAGSRTAAAARRLDTRHRLSLTGTPVENHLGELWSQFHFLLPGLLGEARAFQKHWRTPIERDGDLQRARLLALRVRPFILRRQRDEVARDLPPLTEQRIALPLTGAQHARYEALRLGCEKRVRELIDRMGWQAARFAVLEVLLRLRQQCCDPRLLQPEAAVDPAQPLPAGHSAKLDWLRATLPTLAAEGRRIVLFSQFRRWLGLLEPELDALGLTRLSLTGDTPTAHRGALVERFQRGEATVLLASLKAGGTGLNLTAADTVILLDPWWNPAVEAQAAARAHRIGQTRPVWVARLVAAGSIEERMHALQQRKAALASVATEAGRHRLAFFGAEEVAGLLAPLSPIGQDDDGSDSPGQ